MFWIIVGGVSHGATVIRVGGRVAGKAGKGGGANWVPGSGSGVTAPPYHDPITLTLILLVLAGFVLVFAAVGAVLAFRQPAVVPEPVPDSELVVTSGAAYPVLKPELPPVVRAGSSSSSSSRQVTRTMRIAATIYACPCDECGAVRSQPCKLLLLPGEKVAVLDRDRNWLCHMGRIVSGTKSNKKLYLELLRNWDGDIPEELKGMY